jgi:SAM-dependent methyltransferase
MKDALNHAPVTRWEKVAETRWGRYVSQIEKDAILYAHRAAGEPAQALEIGCEGGRWSRLLADLGWNLQCIDTDPKVLAVCQERIPAARCILVSPDSTSLPCATGSMALILCIEVCPVIEADWFLPEARRSLSDGGLLVGTFHNAASLRGVFVMAKRWFWPKPWYPFYQLPYRRWKKNALRTGFMIPYEQGFCWFPFSRASDSPLVPKFTLLERKLGLNRLVDFSPWIVFIARKGAPPRPQS